MSQYQISRLCTAFLVFFVTGCANNKQQSSTTSINHGPTSGIVTVKGAKLPYSVDGSGTPCIVIGVSKQYLRAFSEQLKEHFRFIHIDCRLDVPYDSSFQVSNITMDTFSDDIDTVRRTLGLEKVCVLGHSVHGIFALEYARKYPEHASHVIMIGTQPFWNDRSREVEAQYWESHASEERRSILKRNTEQLKEAGNGLSLGEAFIREYVANGPKYWYDPTYDSSWLWEEVEWSDESFDVYNHFGNVVLDGYSVAEGKEVNTPVFLALGRYDFAAPYTLWDDVRDKLPNLQYQLFESSGHWPMLEERSLFDEKLIAWIKGS